MITIMPLTLPFSSSVINQIKCLNKKNKKHRTKKKQEKIRSKLELSSQSKTAPAQPKWKTSNEALQKIKFKSNNNNNNKKLSKNSWWFMDELEIQREKSLKSMFFSVEFFNFSYYNVWASSRCWSLCIKLAFDYTSMIIHFERSTL